MFFAYTTANFMIFIAFYILIYKMYKNTSYIYTQLLNVYVYTTIFVSLSVLEYGFYITESQNYSYLNGASFVFLVFMIFFFSTLKIFINFLTPISIPKQKILSPKKKKQYSIIMLIFAIFLLILLNINLILSPIPAFSDNVNRLSYWENSRWPFLASLLGERSIPIAIALGCIFNHFKGAGYNFLKKTTMVVFVFYLVYLLMLGHKFSPIMLGIIFFGLPVMMTTKPSIKSITSHSIAIFIIGISYVIYVYSDIETGIVNEYGGAVGGVLYRVFILQGHVFWNTFDTLNSPNAQMGDSWSNLLWLIKNEFDGLMLSMYAVSPSLAEGYILNGVRFTAGYPGFLFLTPIIFSLIFFIVILFLYAIILVRTANLAKSHSVFRLFLYIFLIYLFHFGLTMGDFRFFYSSKFLFIIFTILITEAAFISTKAKIKTIYKQEILIK